MTPNSSTKIERPLSPHLSVYKPQLTSGMSIFHRLTGIALAFSLPVFVALLVSLAAGRDYYNDLVNLFHNPIGQVVLFGWCFSFFYHLMCGIRHLMWDAGYWLSLKAVYISGYVGIILAVFLTVSVALKVYGVIPS